MNLLCKEIKVSHLAARQGAATFAFMLSSMFVCLFVCLFVCSFDTTRTDIMFFLGIFIP